MSLFFLNLVHLQKGGGVQEISNSLFLQAVAHSQKCAKGVLVCLFSLNLAYSQKDVQEVSADPEVLQQLVLWPSLPSCPSPRSLLPSNNNAISMPLPKVP
jgi:hypothetical protein